LRRHWTGLEATLWTAFLAALLFALWSALEALARARPGWQLPTAWCAAAALAAGALHFSGSSVLALLALVLAAALFPCAVLGLVRPSLVWSPGAVAPFVLTYLGLVWAGRFTSDLTFRSFLLLTPAPVLPALALLPLFARSRWRGPLGIFLAAGPAGLALLLELALIPESPY
jgi:hypothetical protein